MTARALGPPLKLPLLWASFAALLTGNLLTIYAVTGNQASVLYTSYSPLQAHWTSCIGLALVGVSTWLAMASMVGVCRDCEAQPRRPHPTGRIHLAGLLPSLAWLVCGC